MLCMTHNLPLVTLISIDTLNEKYFDIMSFPLSKRWFRGTEFQAASRQTNPTQPNPVSHCFD